jgi:uncharacterized damage-inducible protein DinB
MSGNQSAETPAKKRFLDSYRNEHSTTLKVLGAYPTGQHGFKPHERSNSALQLAWTFVIEEQLILRALTGQPVLGGGFPKPPDTWEEVLAAYNAGHEAIVHAIESAADQDLTGTATFFVGPKQTGEIPMEQFLTFMLHDQIHHRGQMSVYLRMAGGRVPSIYGPSADEPWN